MMPPVYELRYTGAKHIEADADAFLDALPGPTCILRPGRDPARRRAVAGMLHGNEPSGFRAIHRALKDPRPPAVTTVFFLGAVDAARTAPRYSRRMLPGRHDLNRCFNGSTDDLDHHLASRALAWLTQSPLEAAIDLHNNSGANPAYAVSLSDSAAHLALASYFSALFVHADWSLGTLMEALDSHCPTVTIECGKALTARADSVAWQGLQAFLYTDTLRARPPSLEVLRILSNPVRVTLRAGFSLAFAAAPVSADFVMDADIDRHNFERLPARTRLGWVRTHHLPLEARTTDGTDIASELFDLDGNLLVTKRPLTPMMMTTVAAIAQSDCLFYAVFD